MSERPEEGVRSQATGVMGDCKLPNMGARNWTWAFCCCFVKTQFSFPISHSLCWYFYPAPEFNVLCCSVVDWTFFEIVILFKAKFFNSFLIFQSTECLQFLSWDITGFSWSHVDLLLHISSVSMLEQMTFREYFFCYCMFCFPLLILWGFSC